MGRVNHKKDANNNPLLMFIISIIFIIGGGMGLFVFIVNGITAGAALFVAVSAMLTGIGILLFGFSIYRTILISQYKKLINDVSAHITQATYIGKKVSGGSVTDAGGIPVSAHVFYTLEYTYMDEHGHSRRVKSVMSYTREQANFLEEKGKFMIKCKGSISVILEEDLPKTNDLYNL